MSLEILTSRTLPAQLQGRQWQEGLRTNLSPFGQRSTPRTMLWRSNGMLSYLAYLCWNCGQVIRVNPVRKPDAHLDVFQQLSELGAALPRDIS